MNSTSMDQLLGTTLLAAPNAAISTADILKEKDLVLLYFSASWCPPCKAFTPVLKHFYGVCKQNNVEIIFVSSDKSIQSFQEYFGTMPWLALPMTSQSAAYASNLSSRLSIRSIPQLVVLDKHGNYITNNGKSLVANAAHDIGASLQLIQSWKSAQVTPIDKVNFGMVSSIFSKVKESYNYVTGSGTSGKAEKDSKMNCNETPGTCSRSCEEHANGTAIGSSGGSNSIENMELDLVAYTILAFFQEAVTRLKKYPNAETQMKLIRPLINVEASSKYWDDYIVPTSLEEHRSYLLKEQILALDDTVSRVSEERSTSITSKEVQENLRALGANEFSGITSDLDVQKNLKDHMNVMNEEARTAFARSVLWSEMRWMKQETKMDNGLIDYIETKRPLHKTGDGQEMDRRDLLEFCALCSAVVKLDEVEEHLKSGKDVFANDAEFLIDDRSTAPQRILQLQQSMLCAIGFEPTFGGEELHRIMTSEERDEEVEGALATYLMTMQVVAKKAMDGGNMNEGLTDKHEGGVTKIVSVKYSEKTMSRNAKGEEIIVGDDAPTHARMEQQSEEQQKMQLKMAAQAASMQQSILDEIILMSERDRNEQLTKARKAHDVFLQDAMALPPGPQRLEFLQNISSEQQKLMLIHKLWESRLSE